MSFKRQMQLFLDVALSLLIVVWPYGRLKSTVRVFNLSKETTKTSFAKP